MKIRKSKGIKQVNRIHNTTSTSHTYTIKEIAKRTGLTHSTLRYYEDIGLLTDVAHENNRRIYTEAHIKRIESILCFKNTNLPIHQILQFLEYEKDLNTNINQVLELMEEHENNTLEQIRHLEYNLEKLKFKSRYYRAIKEAIEKDTPWPTWSEFK